MNKQRRKELGAIIDKIDALRKALEDLSLDEKLEDINEELERLTEEEREYMENMPMQGGEKYETAEQAVLELETAKEALEGFKDAFAELSFEEVMLSIDNARGRA